MSPARLGQLLRLYRTLNELSLRDFAPEIGLSISTLSRIECGHPMTLPSWLKIQAWLFADGSGR